MIALLTGTDVYRDGEPPAEWRATLDAATRIVALQELALAELEPAHRAKARVVHQSAVAPQGAVSIASETFDVCALGHLRAVKEPLLLARAVRRLPARSRIHAWHLGAALDEHWRSAAEAESASNPRWTWLGELPRRAALLRLAASRVLVLTSRNEGGPSVLAEAFAAGVPVLSTRMPAAEALLGADHPGFFPLGDDAALAELLLRAEEDSGYLEALRRRSVERQDSASPERERESLAALLNELATLP